MRCCLRCGLIAGLCWLSAGHVQDVPRPAAEPLPEKRAERAPGPPAAVAILFTLVVLLLICLPSRKASR
jgi:hypothetical protein